MIQCDTLESQIQLCDLQVMDKAIDIHDRVMRGLLSQFYGFEVRIKNDLTSPVPAHHDRARLHFLCIARSAKLCFLQ